MKTKIFTLGIIVLLAAVSCSENNTELPDEQQKEYVYDGSVSYLKAKVYDINTDTASGIPPKPADVMLCNINILSDDVTEVEATASVVYFAMGANIPKGKSMRVSLRSDNIGIWGHIYEPAPDNWIVGNYIFPNNIPRPGNVEQSFTVEEAGKPSNLWIHFFPTDEIQIKIYEDNKPEPVKSKLLKIKYVGDTPLMHPVDSVLIYPEKK